MFLKIILVTIPVLTVLTLLNTSSDESSVSVVQKIETTKEGEQASSVQKELLVTKGECKSCDVSTASRNHESRGIFTDNGSGVEGNVGAEEKQNFQYSANTDPIDTFVGPRELGEVSFPLVETAPRDDFKSSHDTIYIPFATKNCGWFCKK